MGEREFFTTKEVADILGISINSFNELLKCKGDSETGEAYYKFLPERPEFGKGSRHQFSRADIAILRMYFEAESHLAAIAGIMHELAEARRKSGREKT